MPSAPHDMEGPPIPEMREALLTEAEVRLLVADLLSHADAIRTLCKAGSRRQTPSNVLPLEVAAEQLLSRSVPAIQIRYRFEGYEWSDTLTTTPSPGLRLIRCRHPAEALPAT